jgi:sigma-E factor negative regulatory protein RseC
MIEQEARVAELDGDHAVVVIVRQSACGSCHAKSGCGTALVGSLFPSRQLSLRLPNNRQAAKGDRIIVGLPEAAMQLAALLLYGLPLVALLAGAVAGQQLAESSGWSAEPAAIIGGLTGLIAGLAAARRLGARTDMHPVMLRRLPSSEAQFVGLDTLHTQHTYSSEK